MSIKAIFPTGRTEIVAHGLHQWDYGQTLEIHDDTLPSIIEVHFACAGMKDAVVRSCTLIEGVATAAIPDLCLEQSTPVVAWVYVIEGTTGRTVRTITLPITARPRPQMASPVPTSFSDRYTELLTAVNAQVDALREGRVVAGRALTADSADQALNANHALNANQADSADHASTADQAERAEADSNNDPLHTTYGNFARPWQTVTGSVSLPSKGTYQFMVASGGASSLGFQVILTWDGTQAVRSPDMYFLSRSGSGVDTGIAVRIEISAAGRVCLGTRNDPDGTLGESSGVQIKYRKIWG